MNSKNIYRVIFLICFLVYGLSTSGVFAQDKVVPLDKLGSYSGNGGVFYTLPRTVIKVHVNLIRIDSYKGPYSAYAEKYIGLKDVIQYDHTKYEIESIEISSFTEPDPTQIYFVEINDEDSKKNQSISLSLDEKGSIKGVSSDDFNNTVSDVERLEEKEVEIIDDVIRYGDVFNHLLISNVIESFDTIIKVRVINDTTTVEEMILESKLISKSREQKASELAKKLNSLRSDRDNLLNGYQEVAYSKESLEYMDRQIMIMEKSIIELFAGASVKTTESFVLSYVPKFAESDGSAVIFKFSPTKGILAKSSSEGTDVNMVFKSNGTSKKISESGVKTNSTDGFYYRIPDYSKLKLNYKGTTLSETYLLIEQFGSLIKLPPNRAKILYHNNSGSVKSFEVE